MQISLLLDKIEACREEMIILSKLHGLSSDQVIEASKKLDQLLNEYQQLNKKALQDKDI